MFKIGLFFSFMNIVIKFGYSDFEREKKVVKNVVISGVIVFYGRGF